ncbi:hypothetical protein KFE25_014183 [Diacronema lutheri]|uniref:Pre-rRNA-processing protein TSR2 homolog n=1 Tax=Diacronema lutheri TaxID=2081491 RepID=A0A8J5X5S3_DIALT|nr:hypothetical protein KFE25_014183 [Diacronema lutheri]
MNVASMASPSVEAQVAAAVHCIFERWTALQLAIDNEWGGDHAGQHVGAFVDAALALVLRTERVYFDELADMLDGVLLEQFATQAEDDSVEQIAERLLDMHNEYRSGHAPTAAAVLVEAGTASATRAATLAKCRAIEAPSEIVESELGSESAGDGGAMDEDEADDPVPISEVRAPRERVLPAVDEDGFELVPPKGRRR